MPKLKLRWHIIIQAAMLFCQIVVPTIPTVPKEWLPTFAALVSFFQALLGISALWQNPDATHAKEPYQTEEL